MPNLTPSHNLPAAKGFSFIELLVIISIMGLLVGIGSVAYGNHTKKTALEQAAITFETNLKQIRQMAVSGSRPAGTAGELSGYRVQFDADNVNYGAYPILDDDPADAATREYTLSTIGEITFAAPQTITFSTLGNGCAIDGGGTQVEYDLYHSGLDEYACTVQVVCPTGDIQFTGCANT